MPHMSSACDHDLVIVGAGFAGAACALAAAQYGLRVCVLERETDPAERLHTTGIVVKEAMEQTWLGRMPERATTPMVPSASSMGSSCCRAVCCILGGEG